MIYKMQREMAAESATIFVLNIPFQVIYIFF